MKVEISVNPENNTKHIHIEIKEIDAVKHLEGRFERESRRVYEKTNNISDLLFWLSEWAEVEEKKFKFPSLKEKTV